MVDDPQARVSGYVLAEIYSCQCSPRQRDSCSCKLDVNRMIRMVSNGKNTFDGV